MPRRFWLLAVLVVGLALHNLVMATLYGWGLRGRGLTVVGAWKEALLAGALGWFAVLALRRRTLPFRPRLPDALALAFAGLVVVYALIPQGALGGHADAAAIAYGARHDLLFVGAYFLGRCLGPLPRGIGWTVLAAAAAVAVVGLVEEYAVSLDWWRHSGARGWFGDQLGFRYEGLSGLPENFVYNLGNDRPVRRLVSTFLSPLGAAYMFAVAVLIAAAWRRRAALPLGAVAAAGLLWTYSRSTWLAVVLGLLVLAVVQRRAVLAVAAVAAVGVFAGYAAAFPHVAPDARFTPQELVVQHARAEGADNTQSVADDASIRSHLDSLEAGLESLVDHPQGYGLGNAGSTAARAGERPVVGESTYTEVGADTGIAGLAVFLAFNLVLLARLLRRAPWVAASLAAVLALAVQTDVIGVPWVAVCVWCFAGAEVDEPEWLT